MSIAAVGILQQLLAEGSWHATAIELEPGLDGRELRKEVVAALAGEPYVLRLRANLRSSYRIFAVAVAVLCLIAPTWQLVPAPTTYIPPEGSWMAECPTAPEVDHIGYIWWPENSPEGRFWCNVSGGVVTRMTGILDGMGITPTFSASNWNGVDPVDITPKQAGQIEPAMEIWWDDKYAATHTAAEVTRAEHDAALARIDVLETALAALDARLTAQEAKLAAVAVAAAGQ